LLPGFDRKRSRQAGDSSPERRRRFRLRRGAGNDAVSRDGIVEGESLHDLLDREKILSPERALEVMSAIAAGVARRTHQGIVHRDLKPLNVMICKDKSNMSEAVKILDFGLAKIKSGELLGSFIQAQTDRFNGFAVLYGSLTMGGRRSRTVKSDVIRLGVMLYQMLAGDVPFKGSSIPAIMKKSFLSDEVPPLRSVQR
jgi:serine/threonine-protein kinase